jgi:hypothetical protein
MGGQWDYPEPMTMVLQCGDTPKVDRQVEVIRGARFAAHHLAEEAAHHPFCFL